MKRIRRFDLLTTDLGHALVVYDLTQIPAEGSGCRWGAAGIPDHDSCSQDHENEASRNLSFEEEQGINYCCVADLSTLPLHLFSWYRCT